MKKRILACLCSVIMTLTLMTPLALAKGNGNMNGGGGQTGTGDSKNSWSGGNDGCRVTVVNAKSGAAVSAPMDFTNKKFSSIYHFGKVNKLQYKSGAALTPKSGAYQAFTPVKTLPRIINSKGGNNIEAVKRYWCSEYAAQMVADKAGMSLSELISKEYKLIIEPIAYFKFNGTMYCMTATEAALYDQKAGGKLLSAMGSLTHKNQPLAIFLERSDLGISAWTGSKTTNASNANIIASLGIGIIYYTGNLPEEGELDALDYEYRVNTDVISSIHLKTGTDITPDNPASVTFTIDGRRYTVNNIVLPGGSSQVVWVKWHTPKKPQRMTIHVSASGGTIGKTEFTANIVDLNQNIPPDPTADDKNPSFSVPKVPSTPQRLSSSWRIWHAYWVSEIEAWAFDYNIYSADITAWMSTMPDDTVPTASRVRMKSGYGIKTEVGAELSTDAPGSHITNAQTGLTYFPEFNYKTYWRLLDLVSTGRNAKFMFQKNEFSIDQRRVHFTPVWYPDQTDYKLYGLVWDAWTPEGMLSASVYDYVSIERSVFDDWYTNRS